MPEHILTAQRVRELLTYDETSGVLSWRKPKYPAKLGAAGSLKPNGYIYVGIDGSLYLAHRLIFVYMTGRWPAHAVDHIDGCTENNRWSNLRDVPQSANCQNIRRAMNSSRTGLLGVAQNRKKFAAYISIANKTKYIGIFDTAEQAHDAYLDAKRQMHPFGTI